MKRVFENTEANYDVQGKYQLHVDGKDITHLLGACHLPSPKY